MLFEGGPNTWNEAVQVTAFNLSWLLDGRDIATLLGKAAEVPASIRPR